MAIEVVKIQRQVRGYLARKNYHAMKKNATAIQSVYRGYRYVFGKTFSTQIFFDIYKHTRSRLN
jgi:myosin heavy subunit